MLDSKHSIVIFYIKPTENIEQSIYGNNCTVIILMP